MYNKVGMDVNFITSSLIVLISLVILIVALRKSKVTGAISLIYLSAFLILWSSAYVLVELFPSHASELFWMAAAYLSATLVASAELTFSLSYTNRSHWITPFSLSLLGVMPALTQILFWVGPWRDIFFANPVNSFSHVLSFAGSWANINTLYMYNLVFAAVLLLMDTFLRKPRSLLTYSGTILAGAILPLLALILNLIGLIPLPQIELLLAAFTLTAAGFAYGLFNQRLIEVIPVTREAVVEGMDDGWIVLDAQNKIIDINPAAEKMIGMSGGKIYGQPISSVLSDFPNLGKTLDGIRELEMKRSVRAQDQWRYLNIRISPLLDRHHKLFGSLIVWRDITERRLAEDARQRARDEMFVLLNAISSAASHAIDLDDFLSESIYQIIYPFRSQLVGIFLMDERGKIDNEPRLFLASHFGFPPDAVNEMAFPSASSPLFDWVLKNRQPLLIENINNDLRIPIAMRDSEFACFLAVPLITPAGEESKLIGCICLARKEKPIFSQDEIVRLSTISDQIATLIDSDRRRKLAITLTERQRLLRDLHDSVSQKLYGLVTLTEAAQAALEAGSSVNPAQVLIRIGENARQAVKEMRLFLYQMQPIDVEKEGLISVLHHRLAAVEGRADIKARLLADENISISKEKEVALYYVAQEALNNVLRHAHAKSVSVSLKQGRRNVIMEILDDGCGFDPKKVDRAGLGLKNMKERILQANGKIKMISKPDQGTKIIVTVRKDSSSKQTKIRRQA